ncbi:MAG: acetate--CoA ligase family protein [Chloroflexia bacterium]
MVGAMLAKYGVTRVNSLEEMTEAVAVLHSKKMPTGRGVGALTVSGGANGEMLDLAADAGSLRFPAFVPESQKIIRDVLYDYVATTNLLDITGPGITGDSPVHAAALDALGSDPNMHIVLHAAAGGNGRMDAQSPAGKVLLNAMAKYPEKVWIRMAIVAGNYREQPLNSPELVEPFETLEGVPFLQGFENGLRAVAALIRYGEFQERWQAARGKEQESGGTGEQERKGRALALLRGAGAGGPTEAEGKALLALYGIKTPGERLATSAADAVAAAREIGFPVVLKIVSPQIQHKTEAGGVLLNVADEAAVAAGYAQIVASARRYNAGAEIQGVSVQEMVQGGRELIVGMNNDPQFGPAVVVGLGGIFVEIMKR